MSESTPNTTDTSADGHAEASSDLAFAPAVVVEVLTEAVREERMQAVTDCQAVCLLDQLFSICWIAARAYRVKGTPEIRCAAARFLCEL